jgi:multidrug efflux pump subunit AcrA (membrane-fusion protein)
MTVNASIITDAKTDVLSVPASAVKTQNGASYVMAFNPALQDTGAPVVTKVAPTRIPVEIGITDDTNVEITSGLTEGQQIVVRSQTSSTNTTTSRTTTTNRAGGFGGPGGGAAIRL